MEQITRHKELLGKTIKDIHTSSSRISLIFFDDCVATFQAELDYDDTVNLNLIEIDKSTYQARDLGIVSKEEWEKLKREQEKQLNEAREVELRKDFLYLTEKYKDYDRSKPMTNNVELSELIYLVKLEKHYGKS